MFQVYAHILFLAQKNDHKMPVFNQSQFKSTHYGFGLVVSIFQNRQQKTTV